MKNLFIFLIILCLPGCILMSDSYYDAQKAEWAARQAASVAYNQNIETKLVKVDPNSGVVTVYNQNQAKPLVIPQKSNPFVDGANVILNSAVGKLLGGGWAAGYIAGKVQGNYTAGGDMNVAKDANNSIESNHADDSSTVTLDESTDSSDNSMVDDNSNNSTNQTATPTIVEQPAPTIVEQPAPMVID